MKAERPILVVVGFVGLLTACGGGGGGGESAAGTPPPPPAALKPFVEATAASNIAYVFGMTLPSVAGQRQVGISTRGGAATGDCDGDGDVDLFITYGDTGGGGPGGPNRLYINQLVPRGNVLLFLDTAAAAGVAFTRSDGVGNDRHSGPTFADLDGDGDLDLFIGGLYGSPSRIYQNRGDCTFIDVTANSVGLAALTDNYRRWIHTISAAFGDYDLDGDLDMFLAHWGTLDTYYGGPLRSKPTDHLWENVSDSSGIRFVNVSESSKISDILFRTRTISGTSQTADFTFTPSFAHLNDDVWPDVAIAGDFGTSQIALNNGDGTFRELVNPLLRGAEYGMGSALGDIDDDGDLDWFVTSIFHADMAKSGALVGNRLFRNVGGPDLLIDDTSLLGVDRGGWGWAACFLDIDNDRDLDIFHTNGWPEAFLEVPAGYYSSDASRAFVMDASGTYVDASVALGLDSTVSGRGVTCADFDNDGDVDILELSDEAPNSARLWKNDRAAGGNNSLRAKLLGLPPNTEAAGARIYVRIGAREQMREIMIGSNYTSQNPTVQIFGLGSAASVDEIRVVWPAIDSGSGPVQPPPTVLSSGDPRLRASVPGTTHVFRHPGLPPP